MSNHLGVKAEDLAPYMLAPGSHERARMIAGRLDGARVVGEGRGYLILTGRYCNVPMSVCATGMGGPQVAIAVEELAQLGAHTFIRVGSCGAVSDRLQPGDLAIAAGVYRGGGTGNAYLPPEFPAVPHFDVLRALVDAAAAAGIPAHVGVDWCADAFYAPGDAALAARLKAAGVISIEMEADTLFLVAQVRGLRAGAIFACDGTSTEVQPAWGQPAFRRGEQQEIDVALAAMLRLAQADAHGDAAPTDAGKTA